MTLPSRISLLTLSLALAACSTPPAPEAGIAAPPTWQSRADAPSQTLPDAHWWQAFASRELDRLIERARHNSHDLAAAAARVRQAQAQAVITGAPLLPELTFGLDGSRQRLLRGDGNDQLDASSSERTSTSLGTRLSASYEVDFWGGIRAARDSALHGLDASRFDRQTVELTLTSAVADSYLQGLALEEQLRIARLNLKNARDVLGLVEARQRSGSATRLELAQQRSLVAAQERQVPLLEQQWQDNRVTLATLLGDPVQALPDTNESIGGNRRVVGGAELLFPMPGMGQDKSLRIGAFIDFGQVWGTGEKMKAADLRYSTGLAAAWNSPMGPLKFSIGQPLNKKDNDKIQRFQFQMGTVF